MDSLWRDAGLQLHMTLYRVTPTGEEQGLISIVQGAATTAKITRAAGGAFAAFSGKPLVDWLRKHNCSEAGFAAARRTFLLSCAGYCVGTYILGIGDRHNDNVMLCRDGRCVGYTHLCLVSPSSHLAPLTPRFSRLSASSTSTSATSSATSSRSSG